MGYVILWQKKKLDRVTGLRAKRIKGASLSYIQCLGLKESEEGEMVLQSWTHPHIFACWNGLKA